jgi:cysteinyl-tRNA synthetase
VIRIRDALKECTAAELRFYFATLHYREPMTYSQTGLDGAKRRLNRLKKNLTAFSDAQVSGDAQTKKAATTFAKHESAFKRFMNDDFYTPGALNVLEELAAELGKMGNKVNQDSKTNLEVGFSKMANVLGIMA